eukprot:10445643-Alexandrium_andersonii.AAC.1
MVARPLGSGGGASSSSSSETTTAGSCPCSKAACLVPSLGRRWTVALAAPRSISSRDSKWASAGTTVD